MRVSMLSSYKLRFGTVRGTSTCDYEPLPNRAIHVFPKEKTTIKSGSSKLSVCREQNLVDNVGK